jgi:hypothetical protein
MTLGIITNMLLSVRKLDVAFLIVVLCVIMLSVIILIVIAPLKWWYVVKLFFQLS